MRMRIVATIAVGAVALAGYAGWRTLAVQRSPRPAAQRDRATPERPETPASEPQQRADSRPRKPPGIEPRKAAEPEPEPEPAPEPAQDSDDDAIAVGPELRSFQSAIRQLGELDDLSSPEAEPLFNQARGALEELDRQTDFKDEAARLELLRSVETLAKLEERRHR